MFRNLRNLYNHTNSFIISANKKTISNNLTKCSTNLKLVRHLTRKMPRYNYPKVRRDETIVENFHGTEICDAYRWLEEPDSEETKKFVDEQNVLTNSFLEKCEYISKIRERITDLWNYPKYGSPFKRGNYYYFFKNSGLQNQSVMFQQASLESEAREFLDPNKFAADGTTSLQQCEFAEDGKHFAYVICEKGSDWGKIKFKNVETGEDLDEVLENVKFSCLSWTHDCKGVFYNQYLTDKSDGTATEKNEFQKLYYHKIGSAQSEDILCAEFPLEPNWMGHAEVSDCGNYVIMSISKSCDPVNQLWYCDLRLSNHEITPNLKFIKLVPNFDAKYEYITNEGSVFVFKTNLNAPKYKLVKIDLSKEENFVWSDLVGEKEDVLESVRCVNETRLLLNYMHDCKFFYKFGSFTSPGDIYYCEFDEKNELSGEAKLFRQSEFKGLDLNNFKTEQVFYTSKDGTKVPMFLVSKASLEKTEENPVFLYGYGGFNISLTPTFSVVRLIWLQHFNGIYACANLRGGGEYGEAWYNAGRLANKQNVFDDFISAGEYLIQNKYTNKNRLCINGGSNGGLLVTACINQRPDLFHAAIADVGVCDMLRFHKFTIGSYWVSDYGCSENKEQFETMIKYSPLHTISRDKEYPYVLLCTADHDDRVVPSHSYKYIAELQHHNGHQEKPFLIRIETKAGHGAGKPTSKIIQEHADKYAFIADVMKLKWVD